MKEKDNNKVIKAYKGFNKDMTCRGFQYEVGKEYETNDAKICETGFHACECPLDVMGYYFLNEDLSFARFCEVEQSGKIDKDDSAEDTKLASSKIKIKAEIKFSELVKLGVEWVKEKTFGKKDKNDSDSAKIGSSGDYAKIGSSGDSAKIGSSGHYAKIGSSGDYAKIGSSGDSAKIGSSGDYAKIGSSGDSAKINSEGEDSVICCAGNDSIVKAKKGSWITLSEWKYDDKKERHVPVCVKTAKVDGKRIKEDVFYKLENGEFVEV